MTKGYKSREMLLKEVADLKKTAEVNEKAFWKMQKERDEFRDKHADMAADIGSIRLENKELLEANRDLRQVRDEKQKHLDTVLEELSRVKSAVWEELTGLMHSVQMRRSYILEGDVTLRMPRK